MNYLERLVRRALLQSVPGRKGELYDPFERETAWELDTPTGEAPRHFHTSQTIPSPVAGAPVVSAAEPFVPHGMSEGLEVAERVEKTTEILQKVREHGEPVRETAQAKPPTIAESLRPPVSTPSPDDFSEALAQADQFMRSLHLPSPRVVVESAPSPSQPFDPLIQPKPAIKPTERAAQSERSMSRRAQTILPPAPSAPLKKTLPPRKKRESVEDREAAQAQKREEGRAPAAPNLLAAQAPQVIVVQASDKENDTMRIGAGAPYFGLGQL